MDGIPIRAYLASLVAIREIEQDHELLLLRRAGTLAGEWCQIAGKIEPGETAWQAALRELEEETGLSAECLYSADICEQFYEPERDAIALAPVFVAFVSSSAVVTLNHEHDAHRWVSFETGREMVAFGGQRRILRWIEDEFIRRPPSEHLRIRLTR
jgi:dihydroneopterin triphosphate diphosphatase